MSGPPAWAEAHRRAVAAGARSYRDPDSGFFVMTEHEHRHRGRCCGNACRHCPFGHAAVPPDLRARVSPPVIAG